MATKKEKLIVETESDTKQLIAKDKEIAMLKMMLAEKQIVIDFQGKMIDLAEEIYNVDIKKKFETKPSDIIKNIGKNTRTH